jgi:hypothetical protein
MSYSEREKVTFAVDSALAALQVSNTDKWHSLWTPPTSVPNLLSETDPELEDNCIPYFLSETDPDLGEGSMFIYQSRVREPMNPTVGIIVCGLSRLMASNEQAPLADRLSPALGAMTFRAIVSMEFQKTHAEVIDNEVPLEEHVALPLRHEDDHLRLDADLISDDLISLAYIQLL